MAEMVKLELMSASPVSNRNRISLNSTSVSWVSLAGRCRYHGWALTMLFLLGISGFWMDSIPCRCQIGRNTLGETATLATVLWGLRRAMSSKAGLVQLILSEHGWLNRSKLMMTCGSKWFLDLELNVYSSSTLADALTLV